MKTTVTTSIDLTTYFRGSYVQNRKTGEVLFSHYGPNRLGNLQFRIGDKFYSDRVFGRLYKVISYESACEICNERKI